MMNESQSPYNVSDNLIIDKKEIKMA